MYWLSVTYGYILDLIIGDPKWLTHPVVLMGKAISKLERFLRQYVAPLLGLRLAGVLLTLCLVLGSWAITWGIIAGAGLISPWLARVLTVWLISTTIASKSLAQAAQEIKNLLEANNLTAARTKVGWIVGRDTDQLSTQDAVRATVETVAENIVDGIIAPMIYCFLGGAPLGMAYKATNTLDSMVGYKNERYQDFGWASARWDDVMNFIPARITALLLLLATLLTGNNLNKAFTVVIRDAKRHPSPNSGYPEAIVAGALGVQLGGLNYYGGIPSFRAHMGDPEQELKATHIQAAIRMMYIAGGLLVLMVLAVHYLILSFSG